MLRRRKPIRDFLGLAPALDMRGLLGVATQAPRCREVLLLLSGFSRRSAQGSIAKQVAMRLPTYSAAAG